MFTAEKESCRGESHRWGDVDHAPGRSARASATRTRAWSLDVTARCPPQRTGSPADDAVVQVSHWADIDDLLTDAAAPGPMSRALFRARSNSTSRGLEVPPTLLIFSEAGRILGVVPVIGNASPNHADFVVSPVSDASVAVRALSPSSRDRSQHRACSVPGRLRPWDELVFRANAPTVSAGKVP